MTYISLNAPRLWKTILLRLDMPHLIQQTGAIRIIRNELEQTRAHRVLLYGFGRGIDLLSILDVPPEVLV